VNPRRRDARVTARAKTQAASSRRPRGPSHPASRLTDRWLPWCS
jgi:hypothetical protein